MGRRVALFKPKCIECHFVYLGVNKQYECVFQCTQCKAVKKLVLETTMHEEAFRERWEEFFACCADKNYKKMYEEFGEDTAEVYSTVVRQAFIAGSSAMLCFLRETVREEETDHVPVHLLCELEITMDKITNEFVMAAALAAAQDTVIN